MPSLIGFHFDFAVDLGVSLRNTNEDQRVDVDPSNSFFFLKSDCSFLFSRFSFVLLGFTGFFTVFYWVSLGLTVFFYCFHWVLLGFARLYLVYAKFYWVLLGFTGFDWV